MLKRLLSSLILFAAACGAQSLIGIVKDPQGQPVPAATLTLFSVAGAEISEATTNTSGAYRFESLPAGDYLLRAAAPGFALFTAENIHVATAETRDITLALAGVRDQIVVTASGTPQLAEHVSKATTVIDQSDADSRDAATLTDAVALVPGIRVQQLGGPGAFTSIQIRGLRTEDTAVLVDGLRLRDAAATQADASGLLEDLLFTNATQVEVMRGSGSSLYGTNAIGGVVNVITDPGGGRTRGSVLLEGGSYGSFRGRAQLSGGTSSGRVQYSLGVAQTYVANGLNGDSPFRDVSTQGRITFHFTPKLRLTARLYAADSFSKVLGSADTLGNPTGFGIVNAIPNVNFTPTPDDPDSTRAARFVDAALILNGEASPAFDYSASYQLVSNSRRYGNGPAGPGYQPDGNTRSLYDGHIQTADAQFRYRLGHFNLLSGGYEFENETYANSNSQNNLPSAFNAVIATQRSNSVFVQDQLRFLNDRLQISAAFRAQYFTLETPILTPLTYAPYQGIAFPAPTPAYTGDSSIAYTVHSTKLRAHVGRGYRAPSLFERFGEGYDPFYGYTVYGDPRLKPEHSTSIDAGIDQSFLGGRFKVSASYFYTWLQNVINFDTTGLIDPATDPYGRFIGYLNTRGGISRGIETSAAIAPTRSLRITAAYTYVNAIERTPIVGDVLQTFVVPRNQFSAQVTQQVTRRLLLSLDTLASTSYLAPIYGDVVTQTYRFNGIHKVNVGASYRIPLGEYQAIRFFVRASNIFNQTYFESGYATPGRTSSAGLQFEF